MAITAELHDGTRLEFPDGTDPAVIQATVKRVMSDGRPAVVSAGASLRDIPRQIGLTARAGAKAVASLPAMASDALTGVYNAAADAAQGQGKGFRFAPALAALDSAMTSAGVPAPRNATERVVNDAASMVASTGGMAKLAERGAQGTAPLIRGVLDQFASRPVVQMAGAAGAGLAGGSVREAGGSPMEQLAASLLGGVAGGAAASKVGDGVNSLRAALAPKRMQDADAAISLVLERQGVDWSQVPERVRQGMRNEVAAAMRTGNQLDPQAIRRLLVFSETGTTPTVGMLRQDPGLITRERNLAKTGANSTDVRLQALPNLENRNTAQLLSNLDEAGASRNVSLMDAGRAGVNALNASVGRARNEISALYQAARDSEGRSLPLNAGFFNQRASQLLDEANVGSFLPADIRNKLNAIAQATPGYELNVNAAEQLKTSIGRIQRNSQDGNVRHALGLIRQALDETPLAGAERVNLGNLPATPGQVPMSTQYGQESIEAFNRARAANRDFMRAVESNPALRAVVDGVEPDQFVSRYVIGKGASAADVDRLAQMLDPQARETMRAALVRHLRDAATGGDADVTKFAGKSYRDAFRAIEDKLPAFFSREEIANLRNQGEAAKYMQSQPAGSAVNNSNSGALMLGRGLDWLDAFADKVPFGGRDVIKGVIQGASQRQVMTPRNALIQYAPRQSGPYLNPLAAAALLPAPVQSRENDGRQKPAKLYPIN